MPSSSHPKQVKRARPLLGTMVSIRVTGLDEVDANQAIDIGFDAIAEVHRLMSFQEEGSDVSRLNRGAAEAAIAVDPHTYNVMRAALVLAEASAGAFDMTVAPQLVTWGYLPMPATDRRPDSRASWRDIELSRGRVRFHRPLWIDLSGIAKGYAVDLAVERMTGRWPADYVVNAGGDLRVSGKAVEKVLLRVAMHKEDAAPVIEIEDGSLASSSGFENKKRHRQRTVGTHVNGRTRRVMGTNSFASVVAPQCMIADGLTKVVLASGPRSLPVLRKFGAAAYLYNARAGWRMLG